MATVENENGGELYKATYRFIGTESHTIGLQEGYIYCVVETTTDEWWLVCDQTGAIGYVPGSYLQQRMGRNISLALQYVEIGLSKLFKQTKEVAPSPEIRALIRKLNVLREMLFQWDDVSSVTESDASVYHPKSSYHPLKRTQSEKKRRAPPPPVRRTSMREKPDQIIHIKYEAPVAPLPLAPNQSVKKISIGKQSFAKIVTTEASTDEETSAGEESESYEREIIREKSTNSIKSEVDISVTLAELELPNDIGSGLARLVKNTSGLGAQQSRDLLREVLSNLGSKIPVLDRLMDKIMTEFLADVKFARDQDTESEMNYLFKMLEGYKDDMQQITNPIGNDLTEITKLLQSIYKQINDAHRETSLAVIEKDNYSTLMILVNYYQVEARTEIRLELLKIFVFLFSISDTINRQLTPTVITVEFGRDLRDILTNAKEEPTEKDKEYLSVLVTAFTQLLSVVEPLTVFAQEHLTDEWLKFILEFIENDQVQKDEEINALLVNLVLAFNLHFDEVCHNTVMTVIATKTSWTNLSERLMLLINRGPDPLANIYYESGSNLPRHSVLKFVQDLYTIQPDFQFFYTSDQNILIEIILRNLLDLPSDSKMRVEYLELLSLVIRNSNWYEDRHKSAQLKSILITFAKEDAPLSHDSTSFKNQKVAKTILEKFKNFFP